ncbi:hypothetical protein GCM10023346_17290 [Arthrobacter gyeryongensis]|uniref:Nudix hydrolase domain-containing protein n=2 Tax=Arthrobacter gyeryongensis TaxID=1650592 RepID=A0ABP9SBQ8_9MICC
MYKHRKELAAADFPDQTFWSSEDKRLLAPNSRFRVEEYSKEIFVYDLRISQLIRTGDLKATLSKQSYVLPPKIRNIGNLYVFKELKKKNRVLYNDKMVGWNTDVGTTSDHTLVRVEMQRGRYFPHLASDEFAEKEPTKNGEDVPGTGRQLFVSKNGQLRDLGKSWLFNGVGTSTLAFTSDGKLVVIKQSEANANNPGFSAPSGSGGLEPKDFRGQTEIPLRDLAANGGNRELGEESNVQDEEVVDSYFLGFGRWLQKAGRPELYTLTFLSIDSDTLDQRPIPRKDKRFVKDRVLAELVGDPSSWDPSQPEAMLIPKLRQRMSLPLAASLSLLARVAQDPTTEAYERFHAVYAQRSLAAKSDVSDVETGMGWVTDGMVAGHTRVQPDEVI